MEQSKNKISFILYQNGASPRYFSLKKSLLRGTLTALPIITIVSITICMGLLIYFNEIRNMAKRKDPIIIKQLRTTQQELESQVASLKKEKDILQQKIDQGVSSDDGPSFLSFFRRTPGRVDKTATPELTINDIQVIKDGKKLKLRFKLMNLTNPTRKLNGNVYVFMQHENNITVWPQGTFKDQDMLLTFSDGEYFGTSRFRPFDIDFKTPNTSQVTFKVFVFDRSGDFIYKHIIAKEI